MNHKGVIWIEVSAPGKVASWTGADLAKNLLRDRLSEIVRPEALDRIKGNLERGIGTLFQFKYEGVYFPAVPTYDQARETARELGVTEDHTLRAFIQIPEIDLRQGHGCVEVDTEDATIDRLLIPNWEYVRDFLYIPKAQPILER
jgi:hypothetical protein